MSQKKSAARQASAGAADRQTNAQPRKITQRGKNSSNTGAHELTLTNDQARALTAIRAWQRSPAQQIYKIDGFAGCGKSTMVPLVASECGGDVAILAPTGKAASRLSQIGCDARTLHSFLYGAPQVADDGTLRFALKRECVLDGADLVIVDESSMIDSKLGKDLVSLGIPIVAIGDPAQLPPIAGPAFFDGTPDALLRQVTRQATGSPVIALATKIRAGKRLAFGEYGTSKIIDTDDLDDSELLTADQIIAGTNATARRLISKVRRMQGRRSPLPERGDRLICLKNDWQAGLLNGAQFRVRDVGVRRGDRMTLALEPEDGGPVRLQVIETANFHTPQPDMRRVLPPFAFANAITCHKSQGSQWPRVVVFDESRVFGEHRSRWLYTSVTRASDSVTVVRGDF